MKNRNSGLAICLALFAALLSPAQSQKSRTPAPAPAKAPLIESIEGPALFKAYCATCHGADAKGTGPMSQWLKITTPDLTGISIRSGSKFPLERVQRIIAGEENITSGHGTREMPVWGPIFSQVAKDQDWGRMRVYNLAKYLETLQRQ